MKKIKGFEIITNKSDLNKIKPMFSDIRYYMGSCVFDGTMGYAYVDNINKPAFAFLVVNTFLFLSGKIDDKTLKFVIKKFKKFKYIPCDTICEQIERIYGKKIKMYPRYSICKNPNFDTQKLSTYVEKLNNKFRLCKIDKSNIKRVRNFIRITKDYENHGIGFCCFYKNKLIGVASSNIYYSHGIEVNIKTKEKYRSQGIATAMASKLILECLSQGKTVSWDAANKISVALCEKLGFKYHSEYKTYRFKKKRR